MKSLEKAHVDKKALVIMGGPSLVHNSEMLKRVVDRGYTVFLEAKALTPEFLNLEIMPDYYFAPYPEKIKDNALQNFIFRSFLAKVSIRKYIREEFLYVVDDMRENFTSYFENWRPHKGIHKRFRWKEGVFLKDSPYDLLGEIPNAAIITNESLLREHFPNFKYQNDLHYFHLKDEPYDFTIDKYYKVDKSEDGIYLNGMQSMNSAAITLYPLLNFMGFRQVFLLGMDMTMMGTMEYSAKRIFKSMFHYWMYFNKTSKAFNACFKRNFPFYYRPNSEFRDISIIMNESNMIITRVYEKDKYVAQIKNENACTYDKL